MFNSTTGVLERADVYTNFFGVEKYFHYRLLSFTPIPKPDAWYRSNAVLIVLGAVVVAMAVASIATQKSRRERKAARMRTKLGK